MRSRSHATAPSDRSTVLLKRDAFGAVWLLHDGTRTWIRRDVGNVCWWLRPLARTAMRRERRALLHLRGVDGVPRLLACGHDHLDRSLLAGATLAERQPQLGWFRSARRILRQLHHRGVAHNDLAKEQNWLVLDDGSAGVVDFQLAVTARPRRPLLRLMARENLRHLVKHKRTFHRAALRPVDRRLLVRRSWFARAWQQTWKRAYNVMTRRVLGVRDGEGLRTNRRS